MMLTIIYGITMLLILFAITGLIFYFAKNKKFTPALLCILALSLLLKIYCSLDLYLHPWDERYHALVAKHLIDNPLKPTLYETPIEEYDHKNWLGNHIWLSKPPLPLWFMAVSIKLFGLHEFSVRIPAIIFSTLSVLLTFLIAKRLFNTNVAIAACYLHAIHGMLTDLVAGRLSSDGVETCFLFFVQLGFFFVFKREQGKFRISDYLITGSVTGLAIMCKWQPALLVLVVMYFYHFKINSCVKHSIFSTLALAAAGVVFAPWAIYIFYTFRIEAKWLFESLFQPFYNPIFNPEGTWHHYITDFGNFFGYTTYIIAYYFVWKFYSEKNTKWIALVIWALLPLLIFSMAEVKRGTYLFISAPAVFMMIAYTANQSFEIQYWKQRIIPLFGYVSILTIGWYSIERLFLFRPKSETEEWSDKIKNATYQEGTVIYNEPHCIELMFYHNVTAYPFGPKQENSIIVDNSFSRSGFANDQVLNK